MCFFHTVQFQVRIIAHKGFDHLCCKEVSVVSCVVTEEELRLSTFFEYNKYTTIDHQVNIRTKDIYHLHCTVKLHILRHIDKESVLCQHRIQCRNGIFLSVGQLTIVLLHQLWTLFSHTTQTVNDYSIVEFYVWKCLRIELIVDYKVKRCTEIGHITSKCLVWINGYFKSVEVQTIIWFE